MSKAMTVVQDGDKVVSECCHAEVQVTRVVHDVCEYSPVELAPAEGAWPITLHVRFNGRINSLDSDSYQVQCLGCLRDLVVEVEED
jgi:hypothetical protein